jgi:hypothetical protein
MLPARDAPMADRFGAGARDKPMRLSTRGRYAVMAMVELAARQAGPDGTAADFLPLARATSNTPVRNVVR